MAQIVLADEINRATPKTQSALLEAMEEGQVTVDGVSYRLPEPFMVMATQNPIEYEGTFPLPEAQLDRFMMNISLGYPKAVDEMNILDSHQHHHPLEDLAQIMTAEELLLIQRQVRSIHVDPSIREYIVAIANATRATCKHLPGGKSSWFACAFPCLAGAGGYAWAWVCHP